MSEARLDHLTAEDLPRKMGRYELRSILGEGGMARVFRAELFGPAGFRKPVALKIVKSEMMQDADAGASEAFVREARLGGLLKHPSIVDVYELGEAEGQLFIAMELVEGMTLSSIIAAGLRPPPEVVLEIAVAIASGLASAHALSVEGASAGLVHRDLKPSNVLISWDGAVKVMDFGIATTIHGELAADGEAFSRGRGTPSYMSPEQLLLEPVDGRSDVFALGLILTELSLGEFLPRNLLYERLSSGVGRDQLLNDEDPWSSIDVFVPGLVSIVLRCLQPYPAQRYACASDLLGDLETLRAQVGVQSVLRNWLGETFAVSGTEGNPRTDGSIVGDMDTIPAAISELETQAEVAVVSPLRSSRRTRTNLGPPLDDFVGRSDEHRDLATYFEDGARLVTVKGTGGMGKTRLARRYARRFLEDSTDGVWFVDLSEARTLQDLVNSTAMVLGVPLRGDQPEAMVTRLGHAISGHGPSLFVFDNFEQLVQQAADSLGVWIGMAPETRFLVTSREPLRLVGEQVYSLQPLTAETGAELFEIRARSAGATWTSTPEIRTIIQGIVRQLDGLPLAIELAAARSRMLPPKQLADRLRDRFALLRGGRRGVTERQASLRGLIDWSWQLLEPWEQSAWAQLSVFQGGFHMEAAEAVLDLSSWPEAPWSLDVVGSLLDKSLLYSREMYGQPRFGMYSSIQVYAAEKLGEATEGTARRHAHYFASAATHGPDSDWRKAGLIRGRWLALERDNLLAAVDAGLDYDEPDSAVRCGLASSESFRKHGPYTEGLNLLNRLPVKGLEPGLGARLLREKGLLMQHLSGMRDETIAHYEQAIVAFREIEESRNEGLTWMNLASFIARKGRVAEAEEYYDRALEMFRRLDVAHLESTCLGNLGTLYRQKGQWREALTHLEKALSIARRIGDRNSECVQLTNLSNLYKEGGDVDKAQKCCEEALAIARELENRHFETVNLGNLGGLFRIRDLLEESRVVRLESLKLARELGNRRTEGVALGNLGDLCVAQGDLSAAEVHLRASIAITDGNWRAPNGVFRASLALVRAKQGDFEEARNLLSEGEEKLRGSYPPGLVELLCNKAEVEHLSGASSVGLLSVVEAESILAELGMGPESLLANRVAEMRRLLEGVDV